jgi:hypothetical protein
MNNLRVKMIIVSAIVFLLSGCLNAPSTEEFDSEIALLNKQIESAKEESNHYSGGLIKILIDIRKDILTNTKLMLEQKRSGIKKFIKITYNINGTKYEPPPNKGNLLKELQKEIQTTNDNIQKARKESSRYTGGFIKGLAEIKAATLEDSLAFLTQREMLLKYDIPFYAVLPKSGGNGKGQEFKKTPGKDIDKF